MKIKRLLLSATLGLGWLVALCWFLEANKLLPAVQAAGLERLDGPALCLEPTIQCNLSEVAIGQAVGAKAPLRTTFTKTVGAAKDNTLFETGDGSISNGQGQYFFVGRTGGSGGNQLRRGVIAFDLTGLGIPAGATITTVTLKLNTTQPAGAGNLPQTISLYRLSAGWGEGASNAPGEEGTGAASQTGDATWLHRFYNSTPWTTEGGQFALTTSASRVVNSFGASTWSSAQMVADVQFWLDNPGQNFGWIIRGNNESSVSTAVRFDSRENPTPANRPVLTIEYNLSPALTLAKFISNPNPQPGERITYTISVTNVGAGLATGGHISDTLPAGLTFAGPVTLQPPSAGDVGSLPILVDNLTISSGTRITVTFPVTVDAALPLGTIITNTAAVTSVELPAPVMGSVKLTVPVPTLAVTKSASKLHPKPGEVFSYTIGVFNTGPIPLTDGVIVDVMPTGIAFVGPVIPSPPAGGTPPVIASNLDLDSAEALTFTFAVMVDPTMPPGTIITNTTFVTVDEISSEVQASATVIILGDLPLTVTSLKPANGRVIATNGTIQVTFDRAFNLTSLTKNSFTVRGQKKGIYTGTYTSLPGNIIKFDPAVKFKAGETLQVSLSQKIKALDGRNLVPYHWQLHARVITGLVTLTDTQQRLGKEWGYKVALGDVNGDGSLDAVVANGPSQPSDPAGTNRVYKNNGKGVFTELSQFDTKQSTAIALGDLDGDGDLDAFVGNSGSSAANKVWLNNGSGKFSSTIQNMGNEQTYGVALGDLNGDGHLDAFVVNWNSQPDEVWYNNGKGNFSDSGQRLGVSEGTALALGDLDNDGDLDAFVGNDEQDNQVYLNKGNGVFVLKPQNLGNTATTRGVALGDVDGDGDLDVFEANGGSLAQPDRVLLNNGQGLFKATDQRLGNDNSTDVTLIDLDGDDDLDALVTALEGNMIWLNTGGNFSTGPTLGNELSWGTALGDLDDDGDVDAFMANGFGRADTVWRNGATVGGGGGNHTIYSAYLPTLTKPNTSLTDLYITTINTGSSTQVRIFSLASTTPLLSCTVGNNVTVRCGQFPPIGRYKIVAVTKNCGTLEDTFDDARGGSIIRSIYCDQK